MTDAAATTRSAQTSRKNIIRAIVWPVLLTLLLVVAWRVFQSSAPVITPRVAFITADSTPYWDGVLDGARAAADQYGVSLEIITPEGDRASQEQALSRLDAALIDGIAISPVDAVRQTTRLRQVAQNMSLVTVDSDSELSNRICFVGMNNLDAGHQAGRLIKDMLGDAGGRVLILSGPLDKANGRARREGLLDELLDRTNGAGAETTPPESVLESGSIVVGPTLLDDIDPDAATQQLVEYLKNTDDMPDAIVGLYGYHAPAIVEALGRLDADASIRVIGFDAVPETLEAMERGSVHGVIAQDQFSYGYESIRILAEAIRGADYALPLNRRVEYPPVVVTSENLASFLMDAGRASSGG